MAAQHITGASTYAHMYQAEDMQRSNQTEWPASRPQVNRPPQEARHQGEAEPSHDHRSRAPATSPDEAPRNVCYEDESSSTYLVRVPAPDARQVLVPKARDAAEPFPITDGHQAFAARLVQWSALALIGSVLGGVGGIVLGLPVVIAAAARLANHVQHVRRWRRQHAGPNGRPPLLPEAATTERLRLRAAFWQGLVALVFGVAVLAFLSGRVL